MVLITSALPTQLPQASRIPSMFISEPLPCRQHTRLSLDSEIRKISMPLVAPTLITFILQLERAVGKATHWDGYFQSQDLLTRFFDGAGATTLAPQFLFKVLHAFGIMITSKQYLYHFICGNGEVFWHWGRRGVVITFFAFLSIMTQVSDFARRLNFTYWSPNQLYHVPLRLTHIPHEICRPDFQWARTFLLERVVKIEDLDLNNYGFNLLEFLRNITRVGENDLMESPISSGTSTPRVRNSLLPSLTSNESQSSEASDRINGNHQSMLNYGNKARALGCLYGLMRVAGRNHWLLSEGRYSMNKVSRSSLRLLPVHTLKGFHQISPSVEQKFQWIKTSSVKKSC